MRKLISPWWFVRPYLHPDLDALNQNYTPAGRRWLLIKPHGRELWLGPLFDPEQPGCWACLQRLLARIAMWSGLLQLLKSRLWIGS